MSDDPRSEIERSRLLEERNRLMEAQTHLERVLSSDDIHDTDQEKDDVGAQEAAARNAAIEVIRGGKTVKTESSRAPPTSGMSRLQDRPPSPIPVPC